MRGRLLNPFKAKVARIDTQATAADPDGPGPLVSGYDEDFREPVPREFSAGEVRHAKELPEILIPCQYEGDDQFEMLGQQAAGSDGNSKVRCIYHFADLEALGLVDPATGFARLNLNDRLVSIHRYDDESLIQLAGYGIGFFCTELRPVSFGLSGGARNLLVATYASRDNTFKAGG